MNERSGSSASAVAPTGWRRLFKVGAAAALVAAILFRRNLGPEVSLLVSTRPPETVAGWFSLLQSDPLLGLAYLDFFDVLNCALVGVLFLALAGALWQTDRSLTTIALASGLSGVTICIVSNTALTMLSLSAEYASATSEAERTMLVAAGRATLAGNKLSAAYASSGAIARYVLIAIAVLTVSIVMRRSDRFGDWSAYVGMVAATVDLAFVGSFAFAAYGATYLVAVAGLLLVVWHLMVGVRLYRIASGDRTAATSRAIE